MSFNRIVRGVAALAAVGIPGVANAVTHVFDGSTSNDWSVAANWDADDVPDAATDIVYIPNGFNVQLGVAADVTITVGGLIMAEEATLTLGPNLATDRHATLVINNSTDEPMGGLTMWATNTDFAVITIGFNGSAKDAVLRLTNNESNHEIGGDIVLAGGKSKLDFETDYATFAPFDDGSSLYYGSVIGQNEAALVEISSGLVFTNRITFEGMMTIASAPGGGTATFVNHRLTSSAFSGLVWANSKGTLKLAANLLLVGDDDFVGNQPTWKSTGCGANLEFNREQDGPGCSSSLDPPVYGDFRIENCGRMSFNACVASGSLYFGKGVIFVAPGMHFDSYGPGTHMQGKCENACGCECGVECECL